MTCTRLSIVEYNLDILAKIRVWFNIRAKSKESLKLSNPIGCEYNSRPKEFGSMF